jgi:hypothetical protein
VKVILVVLIEKVQQVEWDWLARPWRILRMSEDVHLGDGRQKHCPVISVFLFSDWSHLLF